MDASFRKYIAGNALTTEVNSANGGADEATVGLNNTTRGQSMLNYD
jgi:hypothetical protein